MSDEPQTPPPARPARKVGRPRKHPVKAAADTAPPPESDRPDPRPASARPEDPRALAAERAKQILANLAGDEGGNGNQFDAPEPPQGWSYEWKTLSVLNKEDPSYMIQLRRTGWAEVPASRHPEMMPLGHTGKTIERKGMILMERPKEITERFKARDDQRAREQVQAKEAQLNQAPQGQFDRKNKDQPMAKVNKAYEPIEIPKE